VGHSHRALRWRDLLTHPRLAGNGPPNRRRPWFDLRLSERRAIAALSAERTIPRTGQQVA
jgi:hypothetical protein